MKALNSILILLTAFVAVFLEAALGLRNWLGAQIDLLPALMIYASLTSGLGTVSSLAVLGGLWFDSLSANPLGISVLPLFVVGFAIHFKRDLILRQQVFAQFVLGLAASAVVPPFTLLLLISVGQSPLLGWGTLWQWLVMGLGGGLLTPVCFRFFGAVNHALFYRPMLQPAFRNDREIRRGRR
jgi:cell shape-determining protein MreD